MLQTKKIITALASTMLLCLAGCGGVCLYDNGSGDSTTDVSIEESKLSPRVFFDDVGVIPLVSASAGNKIVLRLNNSYDQPYILKSIRVLDPENNESPAPNLATLRSDVCSILPAGASCAISVTSHLTKSGSFILEAVLTGNDNQQVTVRQIIRASDKIASKDGIVLQNDLDEVIAPDGKYSISLPVYLSDNFENINAANGALICPDKSYESGRTCSYLLSGNVLDGKTLLATKLDGVKKDGSHVIVQSDTIVNTASIGKARIAQPRDISLSNTNNGRVERPTFNDISLNV